MLTAIAAWRLPHFDAGEQPHACYSPEENAGTLPVYHWRQSIAWFGRGALTALLNLDIVPFCTSSLSDISCGPQGGG